MTARSAEHVLFHRATEFRAPVRCSTNIYASLFRDDGFNVSFMQGSVHAGHLLTGKGQAPSFRRGPRHDDGTWVFTPGFAVPYMRAPGLFNARVADLAYRSAVPSIRNRVLASGFGEPDVVWTVPLGSGALRRLFPKSVLVFQVVDYYPAFADMPTAPIERRDYERADHVFLIGHAMVDHVQSLGVPSSKITVLGQGVFAERFQSSEEPRPLQDMTRPRAVWTGVLDKCDVELVRLTAHELQRRGGSLVLIGRETEWARQLAREVPCVRLTGALQPEYVARYLVNSDIGLMLYDRAKADVYKGQNPLKLYEYAAAGLSILSTPHAEYSYISPPVLEVSQPSDVIPAIDRALRERDTQREASKAFAAAHDWRVCYARARLVIDDLIARKSGQVPKTDVASAMAPHP
jgi:hypothetical protein